MWSFFGRIRGNNIDNAINNFSGKLHVLTNLESWTTALAKLASMNSKVFVPVPKVCLWDCKAFRTSSPAGCYRNVNDKITHFRLYKHGLTFKAC